MAIKITVTLEGDLDGRPADAKLAHRVRSPPIGGSGLLPVFANVLISLLDIQRP
jgi:hypothetical protein